VARDRIAIILQASEPVQVPSGGVGLSFAGSARQDVLCNSCFSAGPVELDMNRSPGWFLWISLLAVVLASPVSAEVDLHELDPVASRGRFDDGVSSPGRLLGMEIGQRAITHGQLAAYLEHPAGRSDRVDALRRNLLVYIDPMHSPDGRARALAHVDMFADHAGHRCPGHGGQPVPGGRPRQPLLLRPES
jgi:hypothetical protein